MLTSTDLQAFIADGFVRIDGVFSQETAAQGRELLWRTMKRDAADRSTWNEAVVRVTGCDGAPFQEAVQAPRLLAAFDQLVGPERWVPRDDVGIFVVRFPVPDDPGDTGWHVDASFPPPSKEDAQNFLHWRINVFSRDRALLMLFLFSDVGETDAPTRIRVGSHLDVARLLEPEGAEGLSCLELAQRLEVTEGRPEVLATGKAGTVYLCHPFLVHAAQKHRGTEPRFLAQPPLGLREPFRLQGENENLSPVERAIQMGLANNTAKSKALRKLPT